MNRFDEADEVDALIIGTGAGGAPLMWRLARAGLRVVALEAGRRWSPAQDFATDEEAQQPLFWADERLSAGEDPLAFGRNNSGVGVGGSTLHYTAFTPRAWADDFRLRSEFGVAVDWPIGVEALTPYYEELELFLGVAGPETYPWGPPRGAYPLPPHALNAPAELMARGCAALGITTSPAANAALTRRAPDDGYGAREVCTNRGFCQAGCSTGAKASADVTFIPAALAAGAELRENAFATELERGPAGELTGVVYRQDGADRRQKARNIFLCAGAVESPRLLLLNGLANGSGQVGRNLMAHTGVQLWGRFEEMVRPNKGIPGGLISEDMHRPKDADFAGGYLLQSIGVMPVTYASQLARERRLWGEPLLTHLRQFNHMAGINILGDCLPSNDNVIELSDEQDERGLAKPRVRFTNGPNEVRMTAHAERVMRAIWEAAGGRELWTCPRNAHLIGTCRMGAHAATAVVDDAGRSFDVPNLYILDNSIFPTALASNPALTIMALSLRAADLFLAGASRSEP